MRTSVCILATLFLSVLSVASMPLPTASDLISKRSDGDDEVVYRYTKGSSEKRNDGDEEVVYRYAHGLSDKRSDADDEVVYRYRHGLSDESTEGGEKM